MESPDPEGRLPDETLSASQLKLNFESKGFTCRELIALSGSHTVMHEAHADVGEAANNYVVVPLNRKSVHADRWQRFWRPTDV